MQRHRWSEPEDNLLRELFPYMESAIVAERIGLPVSKVNQRANRLGLKKDPEYLEKKYKECGRELQAHSKCTRFVKGQVSWNKGKKGLCMGGVQTQFKAGRLPHNTKHNGYINKRADGYWWIRVGLAEWKQWHRFIWELVNGPVPDGYVVKFIDGNQDNVRLDNLHLAHRSELMSSNTIQRYPEELKQAIRAVSKFKKIISQIQSKKDGTEQAQ